LIRNFGFVAAGVVNVVAVAREGREGEARGGRFMESMIEMKVLWWGESCLVDGFLEGN
jgi:hypothetical protein